MTYLRTSHNLFALILILLISLIANPVFAMSSHMSLPLDDTQKSITTTSQHHDSSPHQHPSHHKMSNNGQHCSDCPTSFTANDNDCSSMEMMANCSHCDSRHCQYSDLPALLTSLTDSYGDILTPSLITVQTISRNEDFLRPPIH
ncbi:hypothetical protein [Photobacterium nomapromontoriensis]|uniref:hypothetical protein n=1 Tax=Photobacterium nomapromontoriensis TaxID=2910237 RepID=UPI003D130125